MGVNGLYGLSGSGLDIESMVKAGMLSRQNQYDKMYKKEVKNEWLKQGFNEIYTSLNTFKYTTLSDYKMQSNMSAMNAESSNTSAVKVTANGAAVAMTHNVTVNSMSSNAYLLTNGDIEHEAEPSTYSYNGVNYSVKNSEYKDGEWILRKSSDDPHAEGVHVTDSDKTKVKPNYGITLSNVVIYSIEEAKEEDGVDDEGNKKYKTKTDAEGNTIYSVQYTKDSKPVEVNAKDTAIAFVVQDDDDDPATMITDDRKKQTIKYTFEDLVNGKTLNDLAADIKNLNTNVVASFDATNGAFSIYNKESGSDAAVKLTMGNMDDEKTSYAGGALAAKLFNNLKLGKSANGSLGNPETFTEQKSTGITGNQGSVTIDGRTYKDVKDNRITVSGVTYNLLNKTEEGKPVTVSVTQDTDKIIENVKKFVEDYNKILDDLTKKYNTKPSGDYEPLSKTQEASMTQEQIDKWTEKAKEGLFYHNDILRQLISDMRDAIMTPVQSVHSEYNSASAIGITSTNNQGHLTLDEDKLKKALAADPDCVYELFASDQDTYTEAKKKDRYDYMAKDDYKNRGIANRLYFNAITDGIKKVEDFAGVLPDSNDQSSLGLLITQLKDRMTDFKKMMDDYQTQLYKRYDALETMIASLNSQYNTLFGGQQ